jgi:uncharacterized membrane protein YjfL (UPF0719 family)
LICYYILEKLTQKALGKKLQNKNTALAIVLAAFILGISLIIGFAIHG